MSKPETQGNTKSKVIDNANLGTQGVRYTLVHVRAISTELLSLCNLTDSVQHLKGNI